MAAIVHKRRRAAERLLDRGADPNRGPALFGTPVHAATGAGEVDLLQLLIDHRDDVNARNGKGLTPLQVIAAGRASLDRLAQMKSLVGKLPTGFPEKLLNVTLPTAGWDACERLLKAQMAR